MGTLLLYASSPFLENEVQTLELQWRSKSWADCLTVSGSSRKCLRMCDKLSTEKVYLGFSNLLLGMHGKTATPTACGESMLYPLTLRVLNSTAKLLDRLCTALDGSLLAQAHQLSIEIVKAGSNSWCTAATFLGQTLQNGFFFSRRRPPHWFQTWVYVKRCLFKPTNKFRTYATFKDRFGCENNLTDIPIPKHRQALIISEEPVTW